MDATAATYNIDIPTDETLVVSWLRLDLDSLKAADYRQ